MEVIRFWSVRVISVPLSGFSVFGAHPLGTFLCGGASMGRVLSLPPHCGQPLSARFEPFGVVLEFVSAFLAELAVVVQRTSALLTVPNGLRADAVRGRPR